jgi:hypothetical protein
MSDWKRSVIPVLAGALVAFSATMVLASGQTPGTPVDHTAAAWSTKGQLTEFGHWRNVPGLRVSACATGNVSAAVTMQFSTSGQFRLRVLVDGKLPLRPSALGNISLPASPQIITPTFVGSVPNGLHTFAVQWKVFNGATGLELHRGVVNLLYGEGSC